MAERAPRYLVTNNKYFQANDVRIDEDALAQLPEYCRPSDTVPPRVVLVNVETTRDDQTAQSNPSVGDDPDLSDDDIMSPESSILSEYS